MKRFLLTMMVLLIALPVAAQLNYPDTLAGERCLEWLPYSIQGTLDEHVAPWGSILDREDRDVMFFGTLHPGADVVSLTIERYGSSSGYAPTEARHSLQDMPFAWHEEMQAYVAMVPTDDPERVAFQSLTFLDRGETIIYRIGYFQWDRAGYPWWRIAPFFYQEWIITNQTIEPWWHNRATGRRAPARK